MLILCHTQLMRVLRMSLTTERRSGSILNLCAEELYSALVNNPVTSAVEKLKNEKPLCPDRGLRRKGSPIEVDENPYMR